jgi:hypothetical protein
MSCTADSPRPLVLTERAPFTSLRFALVAGLLAAVALPSAAQAYLDAGTGSMLVQAVVASIAGALVLIRSYWSQLKGFFGKGSAAEVAGEDAEPKDG